MIRVKRALGTISWDELLKEEGIGQGPAIKIEKSVLLLATG